MTPASNGQVTISSSGGGGGGSGAVSSVANGVNKLRDKENGFLVITHYQRLLEYIIPDYVHVLFEGKIVKSGSKELANQLEEKGYDWIKKEIS